MHVTVCMYMRNFSVLGEYMIPLGVHSLYLGRTKIFWTVQILKNFSSEEFNIFGEFFFLKSGPYPKHL